MKTVRFVEGEADELSGRANPTLNGSLICTLHHSGTLFAPRIIKLGLALIERIQFRSRKKSFLLIVCSICGGKL